MNGKQLKNSILQWAIQGKLVPQDPNDEPASVLLERIRAEKARLIKEGKIKKDKNESIIYRGEDNSHYEKFADGTVKCIDEEIPFEIPQGWEWARLGALCSKFSTGPFGTMVHKSDYTDDGIPLVNPTNIKGQQIVNENICKVTRTKYDELRMYVLSENDIVLARRGDLSKCAIVGREQVGWLAGTGSFFLHILGLSLDFFIMLYSSPYAQSYLIGDSVGTTMNNLNQGLLSKMLIPIPPSNEQSRILEHYRFIMPIVERYTVANSERKALDDDLPLQIKKSILQEAIQGKLVPQDPNDEPASALLERIREEKQKLLKDGKLKKKDIVDSIIFKGEDNKYYEKVGGKVLDISDEIPFEVPKSWQWCRLGYVIHLQSGQDLTPDRYSDTPSGIPYITGASNFVDNTILVSRWTTTPTAIAHHGDLLITCKGTVGAMAYNNSGGDFHIARQIMAISSFEISLKYIELCIVFLLPQIEKEAHSIIPGISRDTILHSLIPIPPSNEQAAIVTRVKELYTRL